jgi:hypothetical protein
LNSGADSRPYVLIGDANFACLYFKIVRSTKRKSACLNGYQTA